MSTEKPDEDEDLRRRLDPGAPQTSARHDEAVLSAARAVANEPRRRARTRLPAWAAAAAGVAVVGVAVWLGMQRDAGQGASPRLVASAVLSAGTVRGGDEAARVELPATPGTVRLELDLATVLERPWYRAELRDRAGRKVWSTESLAPGTTDWGKAVLVDLDSTLLQPGEYELLLQSAAGTGGSDDSTYYYFNVQRRN